MSKKSEIGNEVANSMNELLGDENFTKIFHPAKKAASNVEIEVCTDAVSDFESFDKFAKKKDKKEDKDEKDDDKDEEKSDKKDKKSDKKDDKKDDKDADKDDKKDKKKGKKKPFPFWLKKKKASDKCSCSSDCSCKTGKCDCEGCKDCAACGDKMFASAIKYMVETLTRTSEALDNMGLEKSSIATMAVLNSIIKEATENTYDENCVDENDVRGMDLLLGLEDNEAIEGFNDHDLDDPNSSRALEEILTKNPELADELSSGLKNKFENDVEEQLKDRVKLRLEQVVDTTGDESDIEELAANPLPHNRSVGEDVETFNFNKPTDGDPTIPSPRNDFEEPSRNDFMNVDDADVIKAYKELDNWVKAAQTVEVSELDNLLETFLKG